MPYINVALLSRFLLRCLFECNAVYHIAPLVGVIVLPTVPYFLVILNYSAVFFWGGECFVKVPFCDANVIVSL